MSIVLKKLRPCRFAIVPRLIKPIPWQPAVTSTDIICFQQDTLMVGMNLRVSYSVSIGKSGLQFSLIVADNNYMDTFEYVTDVHDFGMYFIVVSGNKDGDIFISKFSVVDGSIIPWSDTNDAKRLVAERVYNRRSSRIAGTSYLLFTVMGYSGPEEREIIIDTCMCDTK